MWHRCTYWGTRIRWIGSVTLVLGCVRTVARHNWCWILWIVSTHWTRWGWMSMCGCHVWVVYVVWIVSPNMIVIHAVGILDTEANTLNTRLSVRRCLLVNRVIASVSLGCFWGIRLVWFVWWMTVDRGGVRGSRTDTTVRAVWIVSWRRTSRRWTLSMNLSKSR